MMMSTRRLITLSMTFIFLCAIDGSKAEVVREAMRPALVSVGKQTLGHLATDDWERIGLGLAATKAMAATRNCLQSTRLTLAIDPRSEGSDEAAAQETLPHSLCRNGEDLRSNIIERPETSQAVPAENHEGHR